MNHIRQKILFFKMLDKTVDILAIVSSFYLSIILESLYHSYAILPFNLDSFSPAALLISIFIFFFVILYTERIFFYRLSHYSQIFKNVFIICLFSFLIIITIDFLLKTSLFYRSTIVFFICLTFLLLFFKRILVKTFLEKIRFEGMDYKNIMIIGSGNRSQKLIKFLERHKEYGMKVSCIIDSNTSKISNSYVKGSFTDIHKFIPSLSIDDVFICTNISNIPASENIFDLFYSYGTNIHVMTNKVVGNYIKKYQANPLVEDFYGIPSLTYNIVQVSYYKLVLKNIFERLFSIVIIILVTPIMLVSTFIISITSKGFPIFYQERVGLRGRVFRQYKLRTMVFDAEEIKKDLLSLNEMDGPIFKIKNDPRITFFGKILRKFSIDELPQFFNVLKGDMNVVGPRPYPVSEVRNFKESDYYRRHSMKPGITGLWQISGRDKILKFKDCINLDLEYIDNWSFKKDIYIILMTIPAIFKGTGK